MKQEQDLRNGVWITPSGFFRPLQKEFLLEIDAAADSDNSMTDKFWDKESDAFKQDWSGKRIWCNPPYGRSEIYKWVEKCSNGGAEIVVALLPARTDTRWFHDFIYMKKNVELRLLKGRIKFSGMNGSGKFPSMLAIFKKQ